MWKQLQHGNFTGAYQVAGQGPAVVLIHGFTDNSLLWEPQVAFLKEHYYVITPDLPGSGRSPLAHPLSIESMAAFVEAILLAEGIGKAVVIGHSMGGYTALALAEKSPQLLQGLGLFHSTARADSDEKKETRRKSIDALEQYGAEPFVRQTQPNLFSPATRAQRPEIVAASVQAATASCSKDTLVAYTRAMMQRPDRTQVLQQVKVPVLFIIGKDDSAVPPDNVLPQVSMPGVSSIHIFENTGHMGMLEKQEECNLILQQFTRFCQSY